MPTITLKKWLHFSNFLKQQGMVERKILQKLQNYFKPEHLQIINESFMHNVPKGSETHFKVVLVSKEFEGKNLVQRHRQVNKCLWEELQVGVHALSIVAHTKTEWKEQGEIISRSPPCMGGDAGKQ